MSALFLHIHTTIRKMKTTIVLIITAFFFAILIKSSKADPKDGFTNLPLSSSNFEIQWPYDVSRDQRYSLIGGIHRFWVYSTDKPFMQGSTTKPRTELRIKGYDYTSGVWQFEGSFRIPSGTSGVSVMQIFGGSSAATTMMLRVYNPNLTYYNSQVIVPNVYDQWLRVNVIHDTGARKVQVYINGVFKYERSDNGPGTHYFKIGVYTQDSPSGYMESKWTDLKVLRK